MTDQFAVGSLRDQYKYALDGNLENLYGFSQLQSRDQARNVDLARFSSRPNQKNSWLDQVIQLSKKLVQGGVQQGSYWQVKFTQAPKNQIIVPRNSLQALYVDHSAGHLLDYPLHSLSAMSESALQGTIVDLRLHFSANSNPGKLHESLQFQPSKNDVIETATLVFTPNTNVDLTVS